MMQQNYQLIVIEQEKVPLASGPDMAGSNFWLLVAVMLAIVAVAFLWMYVSNCQNYRRRIRLLDPGGGKHLGWNLSQLKRTMEELEFKLA